MTKARKEQVCLDATPFYHCYVRCVRRAFLCGEDHFTGANYDHRKQWIVSRLKFLSYVYAIDICAYAVMSNHYHVVLHVDRDRALAWSDEEVAERWMQLYKGSALMQKWVKNPKSLDSASLEAVKTQVGVWRERLYSIDWFMRGVNETIARMSNEEDNCTGRFWEGRYKSQALLDEAAVLSCMTYVDLNPVRAAMADDLENSDFTSIQQRILEYSELSKRRRKMAEARLKKQEIIERELLINRSDEIERIDLDKKQAQLMPFDGSSHREIRTALPFTLADYFQLVDETGRQIREGKRGFISNKTPALVDRLGINPDKWIDHIQLFGKRYSDCVGTVYSLKDAAERQDRRWLKGARSTKNVFGSQLCHSLFHRPC